jgi:hypothetical protein
VRQVTIQQLLELLPLQFVLYVMKVLTVNWLDRINQQESVTRGSSVKLVLMRLVLKREHVLQDRCAQKAVLHL